MIERVSAESVFALGLKCLTRSRPYRKNDQTWVEQRNGSVVRRLVRYGQLHALDASGTLAFLYEVSRLQINFFQPSFKLKSKTRQVARVTKRQEAPLTSFERGLPFRLYQAPITTSLNCSTRSRLTIS